jgi:hypothetical protein
VIVRRLAAQQPPVVLSCARFDGREPPSTNFPSQPPSNPCPPTTPPQAVEELSKAIVNKLLHGPMTALRCDGTDPDAVTATLANMDALERMFELSAVQQQQQPPKQQQQQPAAGK